MTRFLSPPARRRPSDFQPNMKSDLQTGSSLRYYNAYYSSATLDLSVRIEVTLVNSIMLRADGYHRNAELLDAKQLKPC